MPIKTPGLLATFTSAGEIDTSADSIMAWDASAGLTKTATWDVASQALVDQNVASFNTANGVTVVPSTVTDGAGLQALIDARNTAGGGTVYIPESREITLTSTLTIPATVTLELAPTADLLVNADVNGVELRGCRPFASGYGGGSKIRGGRIKITHSGYTKAAIFLDGDRTGGERFHRHGAARVEDIVLQGYDGENAGIGIHMKAYGTASVAAAVQWCDFDGVNIIDFEDGVFMDAYQADAGFTAFVNGNTFKSMFFQDCVNFWHYTVGGVGGGVIGDISLNQAIGSTYQVSSTADRLILVDGDTTGCNNNYHIGVGCFDWTSSGTPSTTAIELGSARGWVIVGTGDLLLTEISYNRNTNVVLFGEPLLHGGYLPVVTGSTGTSLSASDYENKLLLWRSASTPNIGILQSDGARWLPIVGTSNGRVDFTENRTFTTHELNSRQLWAQSSSATDNPTLFDIGTNASTGAEAHFICRHASYPLRLNPGASKRFVDPFAGTTSSAGYYLSLDTQFAEVVLRCLSDGHWTIIAKRGTISYVAP